MKECRICVMTSTRAEYGLLKNIISKFNSDEEVELQLLVTGTHLEEKYGNTQEEIISDGFKFDKVQIPIECNNKIDMACNTGEAIKRFSYYLKNSRPDIIVILGDRYEAFAAAIAAYILSIPIAHISGGDITEGALDDGFRHCISKLSSLHFPSCDDSARRIIQMGENPNTVFSVGDPGIENCMNTEFWSVKKIEENLGFKLQGYKYGVVTYHPVTHELDAGVNEVYELIHALEKYSNMKFIITLSNADSGGDYINQIWKKEGQKNNNWLVVPSLGMTRYLSAVKHSAVVIGNSSSGIVEAPALGVPTVNIGDRQKGRIQAESVIQCRPVYDEIYTSINIAISEKFTGIAEKCVSPYGYEDVSYKIKNIIKNSILNKTINLKKSFYDIETEAN